MRVILSKKKKKKDVTISYLPLNTREGPLRHSTTPARPTPHVRRNRLRTGRSRTDRSRILEIHAHTGAFQPDDGKCRALAFYCFCEH